MSLEELAPRQGPTLITQTYGEDTWNSGSVDGVQTPMSQAGESVSHFLEDSAAAKEDKRGTGSSESWCVLSVPLPALPAL